MIYNPDKHHRLSIRLKNYDYTQPGVYFITICTHNRRCIFGEIVDGEMQLNDGGKIAERCWMEIPQHFPHSSLDAFVIMPNHVHGIIILNDIVEENTNVGAKNFSPLQRRQRQHNDQPCGTSKTIGSIVRGFKIGVTKWFRQNTDIYIVWQRNFYEHIIRNEYELNQIREYIQFNPLNWELDENYL